MRRAWLALCLAGAPVLAQQPKFDPLRWRDERIERWRAAFRGANPLQRRRALDELAHLRYGRLADLLRQAAADVDPRVRLRAVELVARRPEDVGLRRLALGRLADREALVRAGAARALELLGPGDESLGRLIERLEDPSAGVRAAAVRALRALAARRFGFEAGAGEEQRAAAVRRWRAWWEEQRDASWLERYSGALQDASPPARRAAAEALGRLDDPRAVASLIERLADRAAPVREAAVRALYQISGRWDDQPARWRAWWAAHRDLAQERWPARLLRDPSAAVRTRAARWLARRDRTEAIGELIEALADDSAVVRTAAASALRTLSGLRFDYAPEDAPGRRAGAVSAWRAWWEGAQGKSRIVWLVEALADPRPRLRARAASGLARHGSRADAGRLLPLLDDPSPVVRERAHAAFRGLTGCPLPFDAEAADGRRAGQAAAIRRWHED